MLALHQEIWVRLLSGSANSKEVVDSIMKKVSLEDSSDCAKKLICELQAKEDPPWDEQLIKDSIATEVPSS